jgi:integrase
VRRGEACGTLWSKLNLETAAVKVDRALRRVTGEGIKPKPPKTERSNRPIDIPAAIIPMLKQIKLEQAKNKLALGPDYQGNHQGVINVSGPAVAWVSGGHFAPYLAGKEIKMAPRY